jgi:beta-N-acetylhexosaminidase
VNKLIAAGSTLVATAVVWSGMTVVLSDGSVPSGGAPTTSSTASTTSTVPGSPTVTPVLPTCAQTAAAWPVARRVAQLLMVEIGFPAADPTPYATAGAGGMVLVDHVPAGGAPALAAANHAFSSSAAAAGQTPPFIATDEEGGGVARLSSVTASLPWQRQQAGRWNPAQLRAALTTHGMAMRSLGFTMDLAPVVDVAPDGFATGHEGLRSYSSTATTAAAYGIAAVQGLQAAGVTPVIKHFPGLGHVSADTDFHPATDPPLAQLQADDLVPFSQAVAAGAPVVLMSNAIVPGLTAGLPASLAPGAYSYLRRQVGFAGLALTDALGAGSVSGAGFSEPAAAVAAVTAGADMALVDAADFTATLAALTRAVTSGALSPDRLDASVGRILATKAVAGCVPAAPVP